MTFLFVLGRFCFQSDALDIGGAEDMLSSMLSLDRTKSSNME